MRPSTGAHPPVLRRSSPEAARQVKRPTPPAARSFYQLSAS
jgi:hypothetical protein